MESLTFYINNVASVKTLIPNSPSIEEVADQVIRKKFKTAFTALNTGIQAYTAFPSSPKYKATAIGALRTFLHYLRQQQIDALFITATPFPPDTDMSNMLNVLQSTSLVDISGLHLAFRISVIVNAATIALSKLE